MGAPVLRPPVAFLAPSDHGLPGRLGLTRPEGVPASPAPDGQGADAAVLDVQFLLQAHRVDAVVTLLDECPAASVLPALRGALRRAGIASFWFPASDLGAPAATSRLASRVLRSLARAETVVLHPLCAPTPVATLAACCLVASGRPPVDAVGAVQRAWPAAFADPDGIDLVLRFGEHVGRPRP